MDGTHAREVVVGEHVLTFNGRVLDVFNGHHGAIRVHVARMELDLVDGGKGRLMVKVTSERGNTPIETILVEPEDRPAVESLLADVQSAAEDERSARQ